jgi:hypothetical protein
MQYNALELNILSEDLRARKRKKGTQLQTLQQQKAA